MLTITDLQGNVEGLTGYKVLKRKRNVNGEKTLSFIVIPTPQNEHSFNMVQEESVIEFNGDNYRIKQMSEKNRGSIVYKEVVCIHTLFDLIELYQYETHTGSMTFTAALEFVLGDTVYTWDIIDTFYAQDWENFGNDNLLSLFQSLLKRYDAEFTLIGTHFTFKHKIGNKTDFQFRYNYNIKTINRQVNTNNLSTYIKGFGKKNEDGTYLVESEYTSPNAAVFGIRHAKPVYDERYTTLEGLNGRLAEIQDTPDVSITIDFVDMRRAGYPYDVPNEGDDVFLIYEPLKNLDLETRLIEVDEEFEEGNPYPVKTAVTLSNYRKKITDKFVEYSRTQKTVTDIMEGNKKLPYSVVDDAILRATEALQSAQTELEFENGIIARSKVNPNHLMLLNSSGWGVSVDGGIEFRTAATAEGIVADLITTGTMLADRIKGGTLTLGGLDNGNGKLTVLNAAGEVIADLDAERGGFSDLYVANLESPTVVDYSSDDLSFFVAGYASPEQEVGEPDDTNDGLSFANPLRTISEAIRRIPKHFDGAITITIAHGHTLYESIAIKGFTGSGSITVNGQNKTATKLVGSFKCGANSPLIRLQNININGADNYSAVSFSWSDAMVLDCIVNGNGTTRGIDAIHGAIVEIQGTDIYTSDVCISARYGATAMVINCRGWGTSYGLYAYGGYITGGGTAPAGTVNTGITYGGSIATFTHDNGTYDPPAPPETTGVWNASSSDSWHESAGVWDNTTNDPLQGKYGGAGRYRGCWFFGSSPSTAVTGKSIKQIRVYLQRSSNSGSSGTQNAVIRPHGYTSKPGGAPSYLGASHVVGFKWGEAKWVTLPSSFHSLFANGSAKGIMIYVASDTPYMRFTQSAKIEITYA